MGRLRDRMDADLRLAGRAESTRSGYIGCAKAFVKYFQRPPEEMGEAEVRQFLLHLIEVRKLSVGCYLQYLGALKFLYGVTLQRPDVTAGIPWPKDRRHRPEVMTRDEVRRVIEAGRSPFWRVYFLTAYATGMRRREVSRLRVEQIDSQAGLIRVVEGKGKKDRVVMLDPTLLAALRRHWRYYGLRGPWLFPMRTRRGQWLDRPACVVGASKAFSDAVADAKIARRVTLHGLRHAFATHLLEDGVDLYTLQKLLGHEDIETTTVYLELRTDQIRATPSPISKLWP